MIFILHSNSIILPMCEPLLWDRQTYYVLLRINIIIKCEIRLDNYLITYFILLYILFLSFLYIFLFTYNLFNYDPIFTVAQCPPLSLENGKLNITMNYVGSVARFSCDEGSALVGNPGSKCLSNGRWSGTKPKCARKYICNLPIV